MMECIVLYSDLIVPRLLYLNIYKHGIWTAKPFPNIDSYLTALLSFVTHFFQSSPPYVWLGKVLYSCDRYPRN